MQLTVVVPTYNEVENLPVLVEQLFSLSIEGLSLLIVDDNSPDGTGQLAEDLSKKYAGRIEAIHRGGKQGLGKAYICGFSHALAKGADYVLQMDADLSHSPSYIPIMVEKIKEADVVIGSRYVAGGGVDEKWSPLRKILSRWGSFYARTILGLSIKDPTGGFRCYRASALQNLGLDKVASSGYAFQVETGYLCHRKGYKIVEIPIVFPDRTMGKSKMSMKIAFEAAWRVWQARWRH